MLELLKARKEQLEKRGTKGFTLMEMLIVIAIIAILIAIAIPIFTSQLETARDATSIANLRSAYAEAQTAYITGQDEPGAEVDVEVENGVGTVTVGNVKIESADANEWSNVDDDLTFTAPEDKGTPGSYTVTFTYASAAAQPTCSIDW